MRVPQGRRSQFGGGVEEGVHSEKIDLTEAERGFLL